MITLFNSRRFTRLGFALAVLSFSVLALSCNKVPLLAPSGSSITLTASATVLPMNGSTQLIAQVLESAGTPPQDGTLITFLTTLGAVQPSEAETHGGRVVVNFLAGTTSGTATITATSGGAGGTSTGTGAGTTAATNASNSVKIAIGAAAVGGITLSASPATVPASGGSSTLTANVRDTNGNVLSGVPVSFTADNGSLSAPVVTTDEGGNAKTTLTTTKVSKVTAGAGVASGSGTTATASQTATVTVNINSSPNVAVGTPSPASPSVGQSVTFPLTYTADASGSPVQSVTVDFGDGSRATTYPGKPASVTHTYTAIGSYSVRATVLDALGDTSTASGSVNVGALGSVSVGSPSPSSPSVGQAVTFPLTYSSTGGSPIQRISVAWGDGNSDSYGGTPSSVNHTYNSGGTFAMRVTAFDSFGNTSSGGTSLTVGAKPQPSVSITTNTTNPTAGTDVAFTATVTPASGSGTVITDVVVDFNDGTPKQNLGPVSGTFQIHHVFVAGGTYTVVLTATDSNGGVGSGATTVFVQTATPLTVLLSASPTPSGTNTTETFTATVIGLGNSVVVNYHWVFGSTLGTADTSSNQVTRTYAAGSGTIVVTVTVTTSSGAQQTGQTVIVVP